MILEALLTGRMERSANEWRAEAWAMIKNRPDLEFLILTKRIDRFPVSLPPDWGDGYDNVNIGCTVEKHMPQHLLSYCLLQFLLMLMLKLTQQPRLYL